MSYLSSWNDWKVLKIKIENWHDDIDGVKFSFDFDKHNRSAAFLWISRIKHTHLYMIPYAKAQHFLCINMCVGLAFYSSCSLSLFFSFIRLSFRLDLTICSLFCAVVYDIVDVVSCLFFRYFFCSCFILFSFLLRSMLLLLLLADVKCI